MEDTICALATPTGRSALSVVRMTGTKTLEILKKTLPETQALKHRVVVVNQPFVDPQTKGMLDRVNVVCYESPQSYTGDDLCEITLHGNPILVHEALNILCSQGCRLAREGEFTLRAYMNEKMDLSAAEAVAHVIDSNSLRELRIANQELGGETGKRLLQVKEQLMSLQADIEAAIDFSNEGDVDTLPVDERMKQKLYETIQIVAALLQTYQQGKVLIHGFSVVLAGKPNVGKSTLFNSIVEKNRAIITHIAGTTRDVLYETKKMGTIQMKFYDTAGIHNSQDIIEKIGIQKTLETISNADAVFFILDGSSPIDSCDEEAYKAISETIGIKKVPLYVLVNKSDLARKIHEKDIQKNFPCENLFWLSARTGQGLEDIMGALEEMFEEDDRSSAEFLLTNTRQFVSLQQALESLKNISSALDQKVAYECLSVDVAYVLDNLSQITGETTPEDIIRKIFSQFCIGK
ncbi:MAG: tRNA uridine-5-carboxymethylaminomethyl(34) synthesis GTPase MnmE [Deltaproteobacteria bacterium]|nr:tRNA uridine-5-carboxymethylaminomethyl(34) synthesis GTPase MnmE [Deltaproteobacteria bacterium]